MKPEWRYPEAPDWANYLVQNGEGYWIWYEYEPVFNSEFETWHNVQGGRFKYATYDFRKSIEKRP